MTEMQQLRHLLQLLLDWEDAHVNFDRAVEGFPVELRGVVPVGFVHSGWQLLEHLRLAQVDILDFCVKPGYVEPSWPDDYWPDGVAPPNDAAWDASVAQFRTGIAELKLLALDESVDLFARVPNGTDQTYLRELLLVADHNSYHVAQLVAVRRALGCWR